MMVSSRGRYALRVMVELSKVTDGSYRPLKQIADQYQIPTKYMEAIISILVKAEFVEGLRGKKGGYRLTRPAESYTVWSILNLTEGSLVPVSCMENGAEHCELAHSCTTLPMWSKLGAMVHDYLDSVTLADLAAQAEGSCGKTPII